jgi:lipopolysaccharide exporter
MDKPEAVSDLQTPVSAQRKTSFTGDVLKLVSGTTVAQLLGILAAPFLTRLYPPEAFGVLALFISITSIVGVVACLRYELAIMLPESNEEAANLLGVSLFFTLLISLLAVPVVWWSREPLLRWLSMPELGPYLWMIPPFIFITGLFLALNYWNSRTKHFGRLSIARVSNSVSTTLAQLGLGFAGFISGGSLISATVGGKALATAVLGGQIWRDDRKLFLRFINWRGMLQGIKRHRKFPLYSTWSALLGTASWQLPAFLLAAFFSSTVVGYYALGFRIFQLPMSFIGNAIGQVFFQRSAESQLQGSLATLVATVFRSLTTVILFPTLVLTIIGKDLFIVIFGPDWAEAGVYAQILAIWGFIWFISSPLTNLHATLEMQEFGVKINVARFLTRLIALGLGGLLGSPRLAIALFAVAGVLVYGYHVWVLLKASDVPNAVIMRSFHYPLALSLPACLLLLFLKAFQVEGWMLVVISAIATVAYYLYSLKREPSVMLLVRRARSG